MKIAEDCLYFLQQKNMHTLQDVMVCQYAINECVLLKQFSPEDGTSYNADISSS